MKNSHSNNNIDDLAIKDTIIRIIADHLGLPASTLNTNADIFDDLGGDSFDHIELIITIEERFDVNIPDTEIVKLHKIEDIIKYLIKTLLKDTYPSNKFNRK